MKIMKTISSLLIYAAITVPAALCHAQLVTLWDANTGNNCSSNDALSGSAAATDAGLGSPGSNDWLEVLAFQASTPMSNDPLKYTGPALYGGFRSLAWDDAVVSNTTTISLIVRSSPEELRSQNTATSQNKTFQAVVFLLSPQPIPLDGSATLQIGTRVVNTVDQSFHYVIRSGGIIYVSQASFTGNPTAPTPPDFHDFHTLVAGPGVNWQPWDFGANGGDNFTVNFASTVTLPTDATADALGYYFTGGRSDALGIQVNVSFIGYSFPEANGYDTWATTWNLSGPSALRTADPDGDGLANLMEYALSTDPTQWATTANWPVLNLETGQQTSLLFYRDPTLGTEGIVYLVEGSDDLDNWSTLYDSSVHVQPNTDGDRMKITDSVNLVAGLKRFLRLKVLSP